jgi:hypothetical protein
MAAAALDTVERIDWYAPNLPRSCEQWQQDIRGRYQAIGRYLRPDRFGVWRLNILGRRCRATTSAPPTRSMAKPSTAP